MSEPGRTYDRIAEVEEELWAISNEESAANTIIGDEAFSNEAWLEAERDALEAKQEALEETVTISGEFAGLEA